MPEEKNFLTIPEAARYCAVGRVTLWRWIKAGYLDVSITLGGHHRILKEDFESFLIDNNMYPLAKKNFQKNKILIVDDDPMLREVLSTMLSDQKYQTSVASDGFEAGIKIMQFKPDLIILDLIMPGMDGFAVCSLIKKDPAVSQVKIMILTGYGSEENRKSIMEAGADVFLEKPIEKDMLLHHVEDLLIGNKNYRLKKCNANSKVIETQLSHSSF